jgi:hypothetical protein
MAQAQGGEPKPDRFQPLWSQGVAQFHSAAVASDGSFISMVSGQGMIALWRPNGTQAWKRKIPGVTKSLVTAGGDMVIAYADLDPTRPIVSFLRGSDGAVITHDALDGAIWAATVSSDGHQAAFLTGNKSLYMYTLWPRLAPNRIQLDGIGNTVSMSGDGHWRAVGTWDTSAVQCYDAVGGGHWRYPGPADPPGPDRSFETRMSQNGRFVLGLSTVGSRRSSGKLYLWLTNGDGRPLWSRPLKPETFQPRAMISANGRFIAVNYDYRISSGDRSVKERKLWMLDGAGMQIFEEKGGPILSPELVAIAPDGHRVTATDGQKTLVNISTANGLVTGRQHLDQLIRQTVVSDDGRLLVVYTGDGTVHCFRLS